MIYTEIVEEAVRLLLEWRQSLPPPLSQEDDFFNLLLYLNEIPHRDHARTHKIPLPHSLLSKSPKLCLIIDDTHDEEGLTMDDAQNKIKSENLPVSKVLNLSNLKSDYRSSEARRSLRDSYDLFLADGSVIPMLTGVLGKKKVPVPLDLKDSDWKAQIEKACSCVLLRLSTCNLYELRVAKVLMEKDEIVENVTAACSGIADVVPGKWENIRSFLLKLLGSHLLPIHYTVPISTASQRINHETVEHAVRDLLKWRKSKSSDEEGEFLYLVLYLKEIPHLDCPRTNMIFLPHSFLSESPELCLVIDDRQEEGPTKEEVQKKIKSENLPVSNVLKLSELRSDYCSSEARRELCDSYDGFLADESVIPLLAGPLGKVPLRFDFTDGDWEGQIERACSCTLLCLSTAKYYEVRVAEVLMEMDEIVENVVYAVNTIAMAVPGHWGNIGSIHLKLLKSHQLPIYQEDSD